MLLSKNFTLQELTISQTASRLGLNNKPGKAEIENLKRLCNTVLQPLRDKLGKPISITSGFRSLQVNRSVGGSSTSAHVYGLAADIHVNEMSSSALMKFIRNSGISVDQCIDEFGSWVHVGLSGGINRNQYLIARYSKGAVIYTQV